MGEQENDVRKRRHLTPEEKYQIFIEATMDFERYADHKEEIGRQNRRS